MPLSNLTAAVNLVRATWPEAVLAINEDFCAVVSGYNQQNESISADGGESQASSPHRP